MVEQHGEEQQVLPDVRLLFVLVAVFVLGAIALIGRFGGDDGAAERRVQLGRLEVLMSEMTSEPLVIADLPGIVITRGGIDPAAETPLWGEANGALPLDRREALFALDLSDPQDGATLQWCASSKRFEHPEGVRAYGVDGRLVSGEGRRGMDRRALSVVGSGLVEVDPGRWVSGLPVDFRDAQQRPRGPACTG